MPVEFILNTDAFDLSVALKHRPKILESKYPFEWSVVYSLDPGRYQLRLDEGLVSSMSLVIIDGQSTDDVAMRQGAELCTRYFSEPPVFLLPGNELPIECHVNLQLLSAGHSFFYFQAFRPMQVGFFLQHTTTAMGMRLVNVNGAIITRESSPHSSIIPVPNYPRKVRIRGALVPVEFEFDWRNESLCLQNLSSVAIEH